MPTLDDRRRLALDTILRKDVKGIAIWLINPMEWAMIDRIAGAPEGSYKAKPVETYRRMLVNSGCCAVDQWIPTNPLSMGAHGYEAETPRGATTGAEAVVLDGMEIREPEDVAAHMERHAFPQLRRAAAEFDEEQATRAFVESEAAIQAEIGPEMLKVPYCPSFPCLGYGSYGYANYFMAYALYPNVMETSFRLQADLAVLCNRAIARGIERAGLAPYLRLDHDMADSRGTLVDVRSLDRIWFPHFARSIEPLLKARITMIWHCDGNLSAMVPRLIDAGLEGFQGFQYEDGMDYAKICRMKTRAGQGLLIIGGVSVTRTLPYGTPQDVKDELKWLVDNGPRRGLLLACSSSIAPGVPWPNLEALIDGLNYYRVHGRG